MVLIEKENMDNIDKIRIRLNKLEEFSNFLKAYQGITAEELLKNTEKRGAIERYLELAVESCIDISELIITDQRLTVPTKASEAIKILGREKIIDAEFANAFSKIVGFRNILVHDYIDIDYKEVADKVNNRLFDFDRFAQEVAQFLTSKR